MKSNDLFLQMEQVLAEMNHAQWEALADPLDDEKLRRFAEVRVKYWRLACSSTCRTQLESATLAEDRI